MLRYSSIIFSVIKISWHDQLTFVYKRYTMQGIMKDDSLLNRQAL